MIYWYCLRTVDMDRSHLIRLAQRLMNRYPMIRFQLGDKDSNHLDLIAFQPFDLDRCNSMSQCRGSVTAQLSDLCQISFDSLPKEIQELAFPPIA